MQTTITSKTKLSYESSSSPITSILPSTTFGSKTILYLVPKGSPSKKYLPIYKKSIFYYNKPYFFLEE